jgi:hypothetical protein
MVVQSPFGSGAVPPGNKKVRGRFGTAITALYTKGFGISMIILYILHFSPHIGKCAGDFGCFVQFIAP